MDSLSDAGVAVLGGYLIGSISFALLLGKWKGVDLRKVGSGNLGATNVGRFLGRKYGLLVYFLDACKGFLPALGVWHWRQDWTLAVLAAAAAVCGHIWPLYLRFRGGKGVATLTGAMLFLAPLPLLAGAGLLTLVVLTTGFMSLGSMVLALSLPLFHFGFQGKEAFGEQLPVFCFTLGTGILVLYTHRSNIRHLLAGTERRVGPRRHQS
ncbi:MAG: glycerol-3-phosphate 1-O-acyltransferase [Planctomycetota bacterium]|nr:MAG: glycerol-3-phosphate 1-O-acyltransferase [Planctomycetota bacterium]